MTRIGLLSDTHGFISERLFLFFEKVDEIWHAGDIGTLSVAQRLSAFKPFRAVYGNIDNHEIRSFYPQHQRFFCEGIDVWITHIGGYPGRYDRSVKPEIFLNPPKLFISGHSHILKIINDPKLGLLHINPGAAGYYGFHKVCTAIRFIIDGEEIKDLEIWEKQRNALSS
jgi:putative phosphoesterase